MLICFCFILFLPTHTNTYYTLIIFISQYFYCYMHFLCICIGRRDAKMDATASASAASSMIPQSGFALARTTIAELQAGNIDLSRYKPSAKQWVEYQQQQQAIDQANNMNPAVMTEKKIRALVMRYWITGRVAEIDHAQATYKVGDEFGRTIRVNAQFVGEEDRRKLEIGDYVSAVGIWKKTLNMLVAHVLHIFEDESNAFGSIASSSSPARLSNSEIRTQAWKLLIEKQNRFLNRITIDLSEETHV